MQKITPHLWFDKGAREAAEFYLSVFEHSKIKNVRTVRHTPSGSVDIVNLQIYGQDFTLISAGPSFKLTPAVSFVVACESKEEAKKIWNRLFDGSSVIMEIDKYPFSELYGWLKDRYGVSWQIMFADSHPFKQKIIPTLMFVGQIDGRGGETFNLYASLLKNTKIRNIILYGKNKETDGKRDLRKAAITLRSRVTVRKGY